MSEQSFTRLEKAMLRALRCGLCEGTEIGLKVLWRMSSGNLDKARATVKALLPHYSDIPSVLNADEREFNQAFDMVCGELNDGIELEWIS